MLRVVRVLPPDQPLGVLWDQYRLDELVQLVQVDIGKDRGNESGSRAALLRPGPLRTVLAGCPRTRLKQALKASRRAEVWSSCWAGMSPASAEGMDETTIVGLAVRHGGDALFPDRDHRDPHPLFPFGRALRLLIGVEQKPAAVGAPAVLNTEKVSDRGAERWRRLLATTLRPIVGERRIVG